MVLQAYVDESISERGKKPYVVAGYVATAESWARFSAEWEPLLKWTGYGNKGRRFKMSEMRKKMDKVPAFYDVILRNVLFRVDATIFQDDLEAAFARIWSDNTELIIPPAGEIHNVVKTALVGGVYKAMSDDKYIEGLTDIPIRSIIKNNRGMIDFYFDEDSSSEHLTEWWNARYVDDNRFSMDVIGEKPEFRDDEVFLPLQAADFWAWWVRFGAETGTEEDIKKYDKFGSWQAPGHIHGLSFTTNEDQLTEEIIGLMTKNSLCVANIYDAKYRPPTEHARFVHRPKRRSSYLSLIDGFLTSLNKRLGR